MSRTLKTIALCLVPMVALGAANAPGEAARWQALVAHLPAPPATLAQTAGMAGAVRDAHGDIVLGPTDPALRQSRSAYHAAVDAMDTMPPGAGVPGSADAEELAKRMEHASQDQQMAMAMQYAMQARATASMPDPNAMRAEGDATRYVTSQQARIHQALDAAQSELRKLQAEYATRHSAADAVLHQAYYNCPVPASCGDRTNCSPDAGCVRAINGRLPKLVAQHRRIAQAELTAERAVYLRAIATLQPVLLHASALFAAAGKAGAGASPGLRVAFSPVSTSVARLQELDATIIVRAAFWQDIQPQPVAPDYFKFSIPADYRFALGKDDLARPPDALPRGW